MHGTEKMHRIVRINMKQKPDMQIRPLDECDNTEWKKKPLQHEQFCFSINVRFSGPLHHTAYIEMKTKLCAVSPLQRR